MSKFIEKFLEDKSKNSLKEKVSKCQKPLTNVFIAVLAVAIAVPFINSYLSAQENKKFADITVLSEQEIKTTLAMEECMNVATDGSFFKTENNTKLKVVKSKFCNTEKAKYICGVIINQSNEKIKGLEVKIDLQDDYNHSLGKTLAKSNELEAGARWYFKAPAYPYGVESYKIKAVSGY